MMVQEAYRPVFFDISVPADYEKFNAHLHENSFSLISDHILLQIEDLVKCRRPDLHATGDKEAIREEVVRFMKGIDVDRYGIWVYYPWSGRAVHILPEKEFIEVRTNRNKQKITAEEQAVLASKKVGIIGLSVGQSVALALATERIAGELRLADFDVLELSNLNRIRSGVHNIGVNKAILVAREIAEIDPYLDVDVFPEGIHEDNLDDFLTAGGNLDLLHEECDDVIIKILAREKARDLGIPVIMEASDRCTVDIERFDLDRNRPLFHGLLGNISSASVRHITSKQEAIMLMLNIVNVDSLSARVKASITEIGNTIGTWPQLASSVIMGGAVTANLTRQVFLDHFQHSGRYQIDIDSIFDIPNPGSPVDMGSEKAEEYSALISKYLKSHPLQISELDFPDGNLRKWVEELFVLREEAGYIFLFDRDNSTDPETSAQATIIVGYIAEMLGEAELIAEPFPVPGHPELMAVIRSMDTEYVRTAGVTDYSRLLEQAEYAGDAQELIDPIRESLLSTFGIAQLGPPLNPYISGSEEMDLPLRLIRQRGVSELLNRWNSGHGLDPILERKLKDSLYSMLHCPDVSDELAALGRAVGRSLTYNGPDIAFLVLRGNDGSNDDEKNWRIQVGFRAGKRQGAAINKDKASGKGSGADPEPDDKI